MTKNLSTSKDNGLNTESIIVHGKAKIQFAGFGIRQSNCFYCWSTLAPKTALLYLPTRLNTLNKVREYLSKVFPA